MDMGELRSFVEGVWRQEVIPALTEYIRIPNKSPLFDQKWHEHGHMKKAVDLLADWARAHVRKIPGAKLDVICLEGRTPVIFIDIPGVGDNPVLLYGHLDKQPEMSGWSEGLGPWSPVLKDEKLYGRGGADDGYAIFCSLSAVLALRQQSIPHARCVILIEACEESGSYDLPAYIEHLRSRMGEPSLVICLDSGCGNYEQLWLTTSLRGSLNVTLKAEVLCEGVHSGDASGVVPSSFLVIRELLNRLEDSATGRVIPEALYADIPQDRIEQAQTEAEILSDNVYRNFPFLDGVKARHPDVVELILNRTWRPQVAYIGASGMPAPDLAGNVLRPMTALMLSLRLPPTVSAEEAFDTVNELFLSSPPFGARITVSLDKGGTGWNAPPLARWLDESCREASLAAFGAPAAMMGEGGSIPFMAKLGELFPDAQFVITGLLGPQSNAHGPNEFLHVPTAKKLTMSVSMILAAHAGR